MGRYGDIVIVNRVAPTPADRRRSHPIIFIMSTMHDAEDSLYDVIHILEKVDANFS